MKNKSAQLKIKVIAGSLKNSNVFFREIEGLRPSLNRHRERLFAWLTPHLSGSNVLDLFAGSGILGIEALSRGAKKITFIEKNRYAAQDILDNLERLNLHSFKLIQTDAIDWLSQTKQSYDLIFIDPPFITNLENQFEKSLLYLALKKIFERGLLNNQGLIYLELAESKSTKNLIDEILSLDQDINLHCSKTFKRLSLILLEKKG